MYCTDGFRYNMAKGLGVLYRVRGTVPTKGDQPGPVLAFAKNVLRLCPRHLTTGRVCANHLATGRVCANHLATGRVYANHLATGVIKKNHIGRDSVKFRPSLAEYK